MPKEHANLQGETGSPQNGHFDKRNSREELKFNKLLIFNRNIPKEDDELMQNHRNRNVVLYQEEANYMTDHNMSNINYQNESV
jgi:hypothetical protein